MPSLTRDTAGGAPVPEESSASDRLSRRRFVQLLGGALSLAGLPACRRPVERILPYVDQPPELIPGEPSWYATAMPLDGYATGLLVESREGRPIKIEGNPAHPASLGAAGILEQGALLDLYDPDRLRAPRRSGAPARWSDVAAALAPSVLGPQVGAGGAGLRLLLPPTSSPTEADLLQRLRERYPAAGVHFYSPLAPWHSAPAPGLVRQYDFARARLILGVNADCLSAGPFHLRYAREFAARREPGPSMNRLYAIESRVTPTGAAADHRFRARPGEVVRLLERLLALVDGAAADPSDPRWMPALAADLGGARGESLVVAGDQEPAAVWALVDRLNRLLANGGRTTWCTRSPIVGADDPGSGLESLVAAMAAGRVEALVCIGVNPCYAAPGGLGFPEAYARVPRRFCAASHLDETAQQSGWVVPLSHFLEYWGDARARDGTASVIQPLIRPLHRSVGPLDILAALAGDPRTPHDLVRDRWTGGSGSSDPGPAWARALATGLLPGAPEPRVDLPAPGSGATGVPAAAAPAGLEVMLVPDAGLYDGRFANNPWLQELPRPLTTRTWGNAAELSPATAARLGVAQGDRVTVSRNQAAVSLPALILPGVAENTVVIPLGYGRSAGGLIARGVGASAYPLLTAVGALTVGGATLTRDDGTGRLALTRSHWSMEGRDLAREDRLGAQPARRPAPPAQPPSLFEAPAPAPDGGLQWAMTVDLARCTGCSACVVACQAENNIPVVGAEGVRNSREMHWIRIDGYLTGDPDNPDRIAQPMLCQHCEHAPCEYVCPVGATTHSPDGLNEMTYNRCVGTRFCSNNCPYKVRRFNWFDYNAELRETERMARNPHVTVRQRGVMEKCTFCVQRIREREIGARVAGRALRGTEVRTACQQACPAEAIQFGSLTEPDSAVARLRDDPRAYDVLSELGTRPRVRYLARVRNPNPALEPAR